MHFTSQSLTQAGKGGEGPVQKMARHGPSTATSAAGSGGSANNSGGSAQGKQQKQALGSSKKAGKKSDATQIKSEADKNQVVWAVSSTGSPFITYPTGHSMPAPYSSLQIQQGGQTIPLSQGPWGVATSQPQLLQQFSSSSSHSTQLDKISKSDHPLGGSRSMSSGGGGGGGGAESSSSSIAHHLGMNHLGRMDAIPSGKKTPVPMNEGHHHQSGFLPVSSVQAKGASQPSSSGKASGKQQGFSTESKQQQMQQSVGGHSSRDRSGGSNKYESSHPGPTQQQQQQQQVVVPSPTQPQLRGMTQEEYMKQLQAQQQYMELLQQGAATYIHPDQLALWQMQQQLAAMAASGQLHMEPITAALLQQYQQQQQQQQSEAMAGHLHANLIPYMHPLGAMPQHIGYYDPNLGECFFSPPPLHFLSMLCSFVLTLLIQLPCYLMLPLQIKNGGLCILIV